MYFFQAVTLYSLFSYADLKFYLKHPLLSGFF